MGTGVDSMRGNCLLAIGIELALEVRKGCSVDVILHDCWAGLIQQLEKAFRGTQ